MNKPTVVFAGLFGLSNLVSAAPVINFASGNFSPGGSWPAFNSAQVDNTSFAGIAISGYTYTAPTTYRQDQGYLWLRNDSGDRGLGYCSEGSSCGPANTLENGNWNELGNNNTNEIIRLARPTNMVWTDIQVSSLDDGGTNGNETGTFYWSNSANPNLEDNSTSFINFSHDGLGWNTSIVEGSIFNFLIANGFDPQAQFIFFRAGEYNGSGISTNGTQNDYLVWGVNVAAPIPEPETYAMLLAGLGLLGFAARRKRQKEATLA